MLAAQNASPTNQHSELRTSLLKLLPELHGRAARLSGSETLAADLVQDTVERALRFEDWYRAGTNPRAYLHQILFSVFITHCRRARRERKALTALTIDPNSWTSAPHVKGVECLGASLRGHLAALPVAYREVVELVDLGERSYKDAASILGVPVGTVMSRLHRARKALRALVEASDPTRTHVESTPENDVSFPPPPPARRMTPSIRAAA